MMDKEKTKVDALREALKAKKEAELRSSVVSRQSSVKTETDDQQPTTDDVVAPDDLTAQIRAAEEEAKAHYDKLLRVMAEFENFKKRTERERLEAIAFANQRLLEDLLPVLDHLDEALANVNVAANGGEAVRSAHGIGGTSGADPAVRSAHGIGGTRGADPAVRSAHGIGGTRGADPAARGLCEGVELTRKQFIGILARHGLEPIEPEVGAPFDPAIHEAMTQVDAEGVASGTVAMRYRRGYRLYGRVVRAALVSVAK